MTRLERIKLTNTTPQHLVLWDLEDAHRDIGALVTLADAVAGIKIEPLTGLVDQVGVKVSPMGDFPDDDACIAAMVSRLLAIRDAMARLQAV